MAATLLVGPRAGLADTVPGRGVGPVRVVGPKVARVNAMAVSKAAVLGAPSGGALDAPRRTRPGVSVPLSGDAGEAAGEAREAARLTRGGQRRHQTLPPVRPFLPTPTLGAAVLVVGGPSRAWGHEADPPVVRTDLVKGSRHHPGGLGLDHAGLAAPTDDAGPAMRWPSDVRPGPA